MNKYIYIYHCIPGGSMSSRKSMACLQCLHGRVTRSVMIVVSSIHFRHFRGYRSIKLTTINVVLLSWLPSIIQLPIQLYGFLRFPPPNHRSLGFDMSGETGKPLGSFKVFSCCISFHDQVVVFKDFEMFTPNSGEMIQH